MPQLSTDKDFRSVRALPFCYLCGHPLTGLNENDDHVLAKQMFREADRQPPLILRTHTVCNTGKSLADERLGQILWSGRGRYPRARDQKVHPEAFNVVGFTEPLVGIWDDLKTPVWCWVQGFHAALYREHLPHTTPEKALHLPFPAAAIVGDAITTEPVSTQQFVFVDLLKRNRLTGPLDSVVSHNGCSRYESVWIQFEDGRWGAVFGLTIDNWEALGRPDIAPRQGCVGFYKPLAGIPATARRESRLVFDIDNGDPLDAFAP